jgi:murein DD-endopeptidase MepM/ murein hydrolase activator NlpD
MNIEKKILEIYEEISNSKKSLLSLHESALNGPLDNISLNQGFSSSHNGVDLAADAAEVKAPADGVVAKVAADEPPCGGTIVIDHADGFRTGFCHMQKINVTQGQQVKQGDVIGISGGGANDLGHGISDGRHLHFTLRKNGQLLNPMDYINKDGITLSGATPTTPSSEPIDNSGDAEKAYAAATGKNQPTTSTGKTGFGQIIQNLKSTSGLSEMIQTKKEFKKFLMNEALENSVQLFGGADVVIPADGAHAGQSGWQSNNAWDIMGEVGTPVYAIADGVAQTFSDYGEKVVEKDGKRLFGQSFTVKSDGGLPSVYYTHLKDSPINQGSKIQCGQLIGYIADFPGSDSDHVHIGVETGHNIKEFLNDDGTLKCAGASSASSGSTPSNLGSYKTSDIEDRDEFIYKAGEKIGSFLFGSKEKPKPNNESRQIKEQQNFGNGVQNRFGKIIIPGDLNKKIRTPISGIVDNSRFSSSCKNQITIKNEDNEKIYLEFCGISKPLVSHGMKVVEGQIIGMTEDDVEVTLYDRSWNRAYIGDKFEVKKPTEKKKRYDKEDDKDERKKPEKERYYEDPAVALLGMLPSMAFNKIFGNRYDKKTGELKQKRWGGVSDKRPVDPWVIDAIKKPFTKKVNEDIERIKKLL